MLVMKDGWGVRDVPCGTRFRHFGFPGAHRCRVLLGLDGRGRPSLHVQKQKLPAWVTVPNTAELCSAWTGEDARRSTSKNKSCRALLGLDGRGRPSLHVQKQKAPAFADGLNLACFASRGRTNASVPTRA